MSQDIASPEVAEPEVAKPEVTVDEDAELGAKPAIPFSPPREPQFDVGNMVRPVENLLNDGSHPGTPEGAILAPKGTPGHVVRVGHAEGTTIPVYLVEFPGNVLVGCLEEELELASGAKRGIPGVME